MKGGSCIFGSLCTNGLNFLLQTIALKFGYPKDTVKHVAMDQNIDVVVRRADLVVYGSFLEEHSFPSVLLKAMCFEKPIVAPDLPTTRKYVSICSMVD